MKFLIQKYDKLMTPKEVAYVTGFDERAVRAWCREDAEENMRLKCCRIGREIRISPENLIEWLEDREASTFVKNHLLSPNGLSNG